MTINIIKKTICLDSAVPGTEENFIEHVSKDIKTRKAEAYEYLSFLAGRAIHVFEDIFDMDAEINLGATFCFTGVFALGPRSALENEARKNGGFVDDKIRLSTTDYLVVGCMSNTEWINPYFGRKLENAIRWRANGAGIKIISEKQWVDAILELERKK